MEIILIAFIVAILAILVQQYIGHRKTMKKYDRMQAEAQERERKTMDGLRIEVEAVGNKTEELFQSLRDEL